MITELLGRTGLKVTQLGYGSMGLGGPKTWGVRVVNEADADSSLNRVLDARINFIDTAPVTASARNESGDTSVPGAASIFWQPSAAAFTQHKDHLNSTMCGTKMSFAATWKPV